jgi:ubiquinone/menaquinone biosynthesis C-methylase UbiE
MIVWSKVSMTHYAIYGGAAGSKRMETVARAYWPTTLPLLQRAGIREGLRCLDLGCGAGEVTFEIARLVGPTGSIVGLDMDSVKLDIARHRAAQQGVINVEFRQANVFEWNDDSVYDLIYVRFLLTHLPGSETVVPKLLCALRPGGFLAVEDINFLGYVSYPPNAAHDRYVDLYREVVRRRGGDAEIGPKLLAMFAAAGTEHLGLAVVYPEHKPGSGKDISFITLIGISEALLAEKLVEESELQNLLSEIDRYTRDPLSIICGPRVFQVCGRRAV